MINQKLSEQVKVIADNISNVAQNMGEISTAVDALTSTAKVSAESSQNIKLVSQDIFSNTENIALSSNELMSLALSMQDTTYQFTPIEDLARERIKKHLDKAHSILLSQGPISKNGNILMVGKQVINDNNAIVDEISREINADVTIFSGNIRIATTIVNKEGKRATGTKAVPYVEKSVLERDIAYLGNATVMGSLYVVNYMPLKDSAGNTVGMLFVGEKSSG